MTSKDRAQVLARTYLELRGALAAVLYEEDPAGMGGSIGAPLDEYDAEAERLTVLLKGKQTRSDVEAALNRLFGRAPSPLVERVVDIVLRFDANRARPK